MKVVVSPEDKRRLEGHLPFYSVDTREEVDALIALALERGEFVRQADGGLVEMTLYNDQTIENLRLAGERLAALHEELRKAK